MSPVVALCSFPESEVMVVVPSVRALVVVPLFTVEGEERNLYAVNNLLPSSVNMSPVIALSSFPESEVMVVVPSLAVCPRRRSVLHR
ncbi:acetoacetate--CoA ligase [Sesbania bispinosa]|nr:acetoacetate--CoA ligase [Sesbania bispinosa]